ncbi:peptidoglycan bridge formation glycyltransferase FemA/FemB family protein [Companilactobacillus sp. DQM5]|uniref:peptidoglycan bridge formation glycyltransferase FemA/FemB family protein n=1 Tax=Companilactobacillus sp. DQM5 TaxID=3463359 RepID=UPI0040584201
MKFVDLSKRQSDWETFSLSHPLGSYAQTINQFNILKSKGTKTFILGLVDDEENIVGGSVVTYQHVKFGNLVNLDHGPLIDYSDKNLLLAFFNGLKQFSKQYNGLFIRVVPNIVYQKYDGHGNPTSDKNNEPYDNLELVGFSHENFQTGLMDSGEVSWQYVKELGNSSYDDIKKTFSKDVTYYLKKNKQFGIKLRKLPKNELGKFYDLTVDTGKRLGIGSKSLEYYEDSFDSFKDKVQFLVAEITFSKYISEEEQKISQLDAKLEKIKQKIDKYPANDKFKRQFNEFEDQKKSHENRIKRAKELQNKADSDTVIIAGGMFIKLPQEMIYLFSGTYEQYMEFYGPYQIQDAIIRETIESGISRYNFYGINGTFNGSDGVLEFKRSFNGEVQQMIGTFNMPVNNLKYSLYKTLKKILGR